MQMLPAAPAKVCRLGGKSAFASRVRPVPSRGLAMPVRAAAQNPPKTVGAPLHNRQLPRPCLALAPN